MAVLALSTTASERLAKITLFYILHLRATLPRVPEKLLNFDTNAAQQAGASLCENLGTNDPASPRRTVGKCVESRLHELSGSIQLRFRAACGNDCCRVRRGLDHPRAGADAAARSQPHDPECFSDQF